LQPKWRDFAFDAHKYVNKGICEVYPALVFRVGEGVERLSKTDKIDIDRKEGQRCRGARVECLIEQQNASIRMFETRGTAGNYI
jgi:hypothetical protein